MFQNASQQQLDAMLRGGLSFDEVMNPSLLNAAQHNKEWAENAKPLDDEPQGGPAKRPPVRRPQPFATGVSQVNPFAAVQDMHQYHGKLLGNMAQQTMSAWQDEHDSRVSQEREMRRMMHEQEMERIRQEALLQRLEMEREQAEKDRIAQRQRATGIVTRQLVNGRWTDV